MLSCACLLALSRSPSVAATTASTTNDLCPATADPCVIDRPFDVVPGAQLDFGLRRVRIQGNGLLDFTAGAAALRSGGLDVESTGTALKIRAGAAGRDARLRWTVEGRCSGNPALGCLFVSTCRAAEAGSCEGGEARLAGAVDGDGEAPGLFALAAAGDVVLAAPVSMSTTRASGDGGSIEVESTMGSLRVAAPLAVAGGAASFGGSVELLAATDVDMAARIDATGGEYDGGAVAIDAGRDVFLREDLRMDAVAGGGFGGELDAVAGRDLFVEDGTPTDNVVLRADGHSSADGSGGDGGTINLEAGRDLTFSPLARIEASGAGPDGFADEIALTAGGRLVFGGALVARGRGMLGGGGLVDLGSGSSMELEPSSAFDLRGEAAGGDLVMESDGDLDANATVDVRGGRSGVGGRVVAVAAASARVGGRWSTDGADSPFSIGELSVEGCAVTIDGHLDNAADGGLNRIVARRALELSSGAKVAAGGTFGSNRVVLRDRQQTASLQGSMAPAPVMLFDDTLAECPACGGVLGPCDDGDPCTVGEACVDGACPGRPEPGLFVRGMKVHARVDRAGQVAPVLTLVASMPASMLPPSPSQWPLRVMLYPMAATGSATSATTATSATATPLFDAMLAPGALSAGGRSWRYRSEGGDGSPGLLRVDLQPGGAGDMLRVKLRAQGGDVAAMAAAPGLAVALMFGEGPQEGLCSSSAVLDCGGIRDGLACRTP